MLKIRTIKATFFKCLVLAVFAVAVIGCDKNEVIEEEVKPSTYADGILLLNGTDVNGTGGGNISFLDANENLTLDVFSKENNSSKTSPSTMYFFDKGDQLYVTSSKGPNYVSLIDKKTLKIQSSVTTSGIANLSYFATVDGKTGYVISSASRKIGLYPVDLATGSIGSTLITGTANLPRIPMTLTTDGYIMPVAKQLVKVSNGVVQPLLTYTENVAGLVKTSEGQVWVGVQGSTANKAKFVRVDANFTEQETIEIDNTFLLPANGVLTASGTDEFIYWQETSTGDFCRFSTKTKKAELVTDALTAGFGFATSWKVNPKTGELYIVDTPNLSTGKDSFSDLYIYGKDKKLRKKIAKVGYQVTDVIFPK